MQLRAPLNPRGLPRSNALLWECYRYFSKQIDELEVEVGNEGEETAKIADLAPEEWTPALLEERQRRLAARAVRLWRSDFA